MAYDGALACSQPDYNFCKICKERLEVLQDDQDEAWYFVNARAIKHKPKETEADVPEEEGPKVPMIVHLDCLRKLEMYE